MYRDLRVGELSPLWQPVVEHHEVAWYYKGFQFGNVEDSCVKRIDCVVPPGTFIVSTDASVDLKWVVIPEGVAIHVSC